MQEFEEKFHNAELLKHSKRLKTEHASQQLGNFVVYKARYKKLGLLKYYKKDQDLVKVKETRYIGNIGANRRKDIWVVKTMRKR